MKKKRFNFRDDFEMLYLRHDHLERAGQLDGTLIKKYAGIVSTTAKIMFRRLTNFEKVGFAEEDVISIANVYMLSYMALYSLQNNATEMDSVLKKRGVSSLPDLEIARIERNRLISYLRQKLHHCGVLCARKARNITVGSDKRGVFAETENSRPVPKEMILEDHGKYGYRKATVKEHKEALTKAREKQGLNTLDKDGFKIFKIEKLNDGIDQEDYRILVENNKSIFYHSPDMALQMMEEELSLDKYRQKFEGMEKKEKERILVHFIEKNKGDRAYKQEIKFARKILNGEKTVV
jgi:hypothetical protein